MKYLFATLFFLVAFVSQSNAAVWYVKPNGSDANTGNSWGTAFQNIQRAIGEGSEGDEIWVAEGTYLPTAKWNGTTERHKTFFLFYNMKLFGGFAGTETLRSQRDWTAHPTILSGDIGTANDISDNAYHVVWINGRSSAMELDGFTITKGKSHDNDPVASYGAGIYNIADHQASKPTIRNCTITGNEGGATVSAGIGMYNSGYYGDASATLTDCTFSNNMGSNPGNSAGAMLNWGSGPGGIASPVLTNCTFTNNTAGFRGGAMEDRQENSGICAPILTNCTFTGNTAIGDGGGAIYHSGKILTLTACTFTNNTGFIGGGLSVVHGGVLATDCTFSSNTSPTQRGGALNLQGFDQSFNFTRCTFSNNSAATTGGAITTSTINFSIYLSLIGCTFSGNSAANGGAMYTGGGSNGSMNIELQNCRLFGNTATERGGAICVGSNPTFGYTRLYHCTLYNNTAPPGGGGVLGTSGYIANQQLPPSLHNCIAWNNSSTFGQTAGGEGGLFIQYSLIQEAACPTGAACGTGILYNLNPLFVNAAANDFHLQSASPAKNTGTNILPVLIDFDGTARPQGPGYDMGAFEVPLVCPPGPVVYVDKDATSGTNNGTSWANAYTHLQDALDAATDCPGYVDEIWVAEGTYLPTALHAGGTNRHKTFFVNYNVKIFGGFSGTENMRSQRNWNTHPTILSGDIGAPNDISDNAYHVVWIEGRSSAMELDGFTITKGKLTLASDPTANAGAGIYNNAENQNSTPTIRNCTITGNEGGTNTGGAGMFNNGSYYDASPTMTDCTFSNNTVPGNSNGGAMYNYAYGMGGICSPVLTNCTFTNNHAAFRGGGIYDRADNDGISAPTLINCTFTGNTTTTQSGGAVHHIGQVLTLNNCTFTNNTAFIAGALGVLGSVTATDCTFSGNTAYNNSGAFSISGNDEASTFTRCTFTNNSLTNNGNSLDRGGAGLVYVGSGTTVNVLFDRCTFSNNSAGKGGAVYTEGSSNASLYVTFINCRLFGNTATERGGAICSGRNDGLGYTSCINCTFYNNTAPAGGGGAVGISEYTANQSATLSLHNCIAWNNSSTFGQTANGEGGLLIQYSLIQESGCPTGAGCGVSLYNLDPLFVNAAAHDFHLQSTSPAKNTGAIVFVAPIDFDGTPRPQGPAFDMGAFEVPLVCPPGPVVYVDKDATSGTNNGTSWANAYTHLQDALDAAANCPGNVDEIWVAEGTYLPTALHAGGTSRHKTFFVNYNVKIYGGFSGTENMRSQRNWNTHPTILSGDIGAPNDISDNAYHVVWIEGRSSAMELDGFTITKGKLTLASDPTANAGAGIYNNAENQNSTPTIRNCTITGNEGGTNTGGAGMFNNGSYYDASPTMTDCTFSNNTVPGNSNGGAMYNYAYGMGGICSPVLTNCTFTNNHAAFRGGGIYDRADNDGISAPTLINCTFTGNTTTTQSGGAIHHIGQALTLNNCTFTNNTAFIAGALSVTGSVTATDCTFSGNTAYNHSGAFSISGNDEASTFTRCTFTNNSLTNNGNSLDRGGAGSVYVGSGTTVNVLFDRCSFSNNSAGKGGAVYTEGSANTTLYVLFTNCRLFGNTATERGGAICSGRNDGSGYTGCFNCTFYNNTAPAGGGGAMGTLDLGPTQTVIPLWYNCIAWNNSSTFGQTAGGQGGLGMAFCLIQEATCPTGATCGNGMIYNKNPLFVNAAANNFHLLACSPAVDVALSVAAIDFDGTARPQNSGYDMGAFEYVGAPCVPQARCKNITAQLDNTGAYIVFPLAISDGSTGCDLLLQIDDASYQIYNCSHVGQKVVTLKATDCYNATSTCTATVTITDNQLPTIACPSSFTTYTTQCTATGTYTTPTFTDNCTVNLSLVSGLPSGSQFPQGITTNVWKATDSGGNTATCSFTLTVTGGQPMTLTCPQNIVKNTDPNQCTAMATYAMPTVTNPCGNVSLSLIGSLPSGSQFPKGPNTVTWKATGTAGATATCSFTITVNDGQAPTIACPQNISKFTDGNLCTAVVTYNNPTYSDNCAGASIALTSGANTASGSTFPKGATTVIWKATDAANGTATCSFTVTVSDGQAPTITCPANQIISTDPNLCTAVTTYTTPTATDNCTPAPTLMLQSGPASGQPFPKGMTTVFWKATDGAGLTKTCSFRVTVNDTQAPTITCPANQAKTTDPNGCSAVATYANATFTDNCPGGSVVRWNGLASGSAFPKGTNQVVFKATDAAGNQSQCTMTITVSDAQLPTVTCPANIAVTGTNSNGICSMAVVYSNPTASDNCALQSSYLLSGLASNSVFPQGVTTNVWKATDESGLTATCAFTVTVSCGTNSSEFEVRSLKLGQSPADSTTLGSNLYLSLAPNPAVTQVTVTIEGLNENGGTLTVFDAAGRLVWQQQVAMTDTVVLLDVSESKLAAGLYFVTLRSRDSVLTKRLTVQR